MISMYMHHTGNHTNLIYGEREFQTIHRPGLQWLGEILLKDGPVGWWVGALVSSVY